MFNSEEIVDKRIKDLSGARCGKLVVTKLKGQDDYGRALWECVCDCGGVVVRRSAVISDAIKKGKNSHCGCSPALKTHGLAKTEKKLHWVWGAMIQRCTNKKSKDYPDYGGRGISVCDEWRNDFGLFVRWARSNGYAQGLTLDRKDNDGNYSPGNCRFVPLKNQMRNQSKTVMLEHNGDIKPLTEWAELYGLSPKTLRARVFSYGWQVDKALTTTPRRGRNQYSKVS